MLVFQRESSSGNGDNDIAAVKISYTGHLEFDSPEIIVGDFGDDERDPAIGFSRDEYLVSYSDQFAASNQYDIYAATIDAKSCQLCEPNWLVSTPIASNVESEIGTRWSGADKDADQAAIAFTRTGFAFDQIYYRIWQNNGNGSIITDLGGSCGGGGIASFSGQTGIGSTEFIGVLDGVDPLASIAVLNVGLPGGEFACGSCLVLPFSATFVRPLVSTGSLDHAEIAMKIPCKASWAGQTLVYQWTTLLTLQSPCSTLPNLSFSNRLQVNFGF